MTAHVEFVVPRASLLLLGLAGCLMPDLSETLDPGPATAAEPLVRGDGDASLLVDATDPQAWTALDLDGNELVDIEDPTWDLAFQRFNVDLQDGLAAVVLEAMDFDDVVEAPVDGWVSDEPDADDDGVPEYVFADWYDYDPDTHVLTPADRVYVVATTEEAAVKVVFESYYDEAGTPARITLRAAEVTP